MEKVVAGRSDSYDPGRIKSFLEKGFSLIDLNIRGRSVLVKPNLLASKTPDRAATTHPDFLRALLELLVDHSCTVSIGDSPGYESLDRVLRIGGYADMLRQLGVRAVPFIREVPKKGSGVSPYRDFLFGEDPDRFEAVINVPKLKTHGMMGMTLGVKNTFGFIRGFAKGRWHLRAGRDRDLFASIIVDIHRIVSPTLTVLDGILGMCGDGPSNGDPVACSLIAISRDAFALDAFIEKRFWRGAPLPITACAARHGLVPPCELIDLGLPPAPPSFPMPRTCDTDWNLPRPVKRLLRSVLTRKPRVDQDACRLCGICAGVCPANAILLNETSPLIDHRACIRCYCCQEMCPHGAIRT